MFLVSLGATAQEFGIKRHNQLYVNAEYRLLFWENSRSLEPEYPRPEFLRRKSACVTVLFKIDRNGEPYNPFVVKIYPKDNGRFRKSALRAIRKFRFKPSHRNPDKKEIYSTHTFKYVISDTPTQKAHDSLALRLEKEFEKGCSVNFLKDSSFLN